MPKEVREPVRIQWMRVRSEIGNLLMVLGEEIRQAGHKKKVLADREVLQWQVDRRYQEDERH